MKARRYRSKILKKILTAALGTALLAVGLVVVFKPEGYFYLYPSIDTRYAPGYSEARFQTIRVGMTKEEVLARLGPPLNSIEEQGWLYSEDNALPYWDFAWLARAVNFDSRGRVMAIKARVQYD